MLKPPLDQKDCGKIAGNYGWIHKHMPMLAGRTHHLNEMKKKGAPKKVTKEALQEFKDLKNSVSQLVVLHPLSKDLPFVLVVDASNLARAMGLFQYDEENNKLYPIEFRSKKFNNAELKWHINDKELNTLVYYICESRNFLLSREFYVFTDSTNLIRRLNVSSCLVARVDNIVVCNQREQFSCCITCTI